MGRLVINNAMTVNGAFEAPSPDEWLVLDPDSNNVSLEQFLVADAMVLGRKTYQGLAGVWPQLADDPNLGLFADRMNSMPKYVASRSLARSPAGWWAVPMALLALVARAGRSGVLAALAACVLTLSGNACWSPSATPQRGSARCTCSTGPSSAC